MLRLEEVVTFDRKLERICSLSGKFQSFEQIRPVAYSEKSLTVGLNFVQCVKEYSLHWQKQECNYWT
jgi:hypothetical protein